MEIHHMDERPQKLHPEMERNGNKFKITHDLETGKCHANT